MRILVLNWRDIRSARGGGAERVTHEVALRLVAKGHDVTWLSSAEAGLPSEESVDGVRIVRRGGEATTRFHAPGLARTLAPDVVLEEINTLPYLSPLWSRAPVLLYMNQLARDVWWHEAAFPVAAAGRVAEPLYLGVYRRTDVVTISRSTRDDLRGLGFSGEIWIAPMTSDVATADRLAPKIPSGRLISIGRQTPSKRFDHAIEALAELRRTHPAAELVLVGDGRSRAALERRAGSLGVADAVTFAGRVSTVEKTGLLDRADLLVGTSVREGWGLTVTEAAARGVPAVVYAIPGFRDAVVDGRTGLLVEPRPAALAEGIRSLLDDPPSYERLRAGALASVHEPSWEPAADVFEAALARRVST